MDGKICYLNTDLDLTCADDLTELAAFFEARGVWPLHVTRTEAGLWYATFETDDGFDEPEQSISTMLAVIESFPNPHLATWCSCQLREFNIGYDCGDEPWAFNQCLSCELLGRIAEARAHLRFTLYPAREEA